MTAVDAAADAADIHNQASTITSHFFSTLHTTQYTIETYGWYMLPAAILLYFTYRYIVFKHAHHEVYKPERVLTLTEQMRIKRLQQQDAWNKNASIIVQQSKIEKQRMESDIIAQRMNHASEKKLNDDDDDNKIEENDELYTVFKESIAKKGGKIGGKKIVTKSGLSDKAWSGVGGMNNGNNSNSRNKFSTMRDINRTCGPRS